MNKHPFLLLIGSVLLLINTGCKKNYYNGKQLQDKLQKILEQHLSTYKKQFGDKTIGFGLYIKSPSGGIYASSGFPETMGEDIHFRGASTTKTFTAASILKLHRQGKLNIDDLITANIPGTNQPYIPATSGYDVPNKNNITIRLLLQHRAGVFDVTNTNIPDTVNAPYAGQRYFDYVMDQKGADYTFSFAEMIGVAAKNHLSYFVPDTAFHYSNTGYNLLAVIIERVSGKRYHQFLQDEFLTPLQMTHTSFPYLGTDQQIPAPYEPGWLKINNSLVAYDKDNASFAVSEGNIISTPADLANWAYTLYGTNKIVNEDLHNQMIDVSPSYDVNVNYGLGTTAYPAELGYGHDGVRPAYMTIMRYNPETKSSYVLFANFLNFDAAVAQGNDLHEIVKEAIKAVEASR
ncbi:MAG: serine hydrolase domain-containing protein [Ferruginibacter sp.]